MSWDNEDERAWARYREHRAEVERRDYHESPLRVRIRELEAALLRVESERDEAVELLWLIEESRRHYPRIREFLTKKRGEK